MSRTPKEAAGILLEENILFTTRRRDLYDTHQRHNSM